MRHSKLRRMMQVNMQPVCHRTSRPSDLQQVRNMVTHMLEALESLHKMGYVHRDVRLGNILLGPSGEDWVLVDLEALDALSRFGLEHKRDDMWTPRHDIAMLAHAASIAASAFPIEERQRVESLVAAMGAAHSIAEARDAVRRAIATPRVAKRVKHMGETDVDCNL